MMSGLDFLIKFCRNFEDYYRSHGPCFRKIITLMDKYMVVGTKFLKHNS